MSARAHSKSALASIAIALALALLWVQAAAAGTVSPLPRSDYTVRAVCSVPTRGRAGCLSLQLVPRTAAARAHTHPLGITRAAPLPARSPAAGDYGLRPQDLHTAYQLPGTASSVQTVAVVDSYNDPTAEADLKAYDEEFGLSECTAGNGCFQQVNQSGEAGNLPFPKSTKELETARKGSKAAREEAEEATGWGLEISLDIEVAHAICHNCDILLVEASVPSYEDLEKAEHTAGAAGAGEISNSWGGSEDGETPALESASPFNHAGIVITASSGDDGYLGWDAKRSSERGYVDFPASSPHVVAVGGTRLSLGAGSAWAGESVWDGYGAGGGGCSVVFTAQPWQQALSDWSAVGCASKRAVADVAADADPYTGVAVRDTSPECEYQYEEGKVKYVAYWCTIGGTSVASPLIASVFALAGGADGVAYPAATLYENELKSPGSLHDVTVGSNGECLKPFTETGLSGCTAAEEAERSCASRAICLAGPGYDGPTGVGTPDGIAAFQAATSAPAVTTGAASLITQTSATLNAEVNPNGGEVEECKLEYGTTPSYGSSKPCSPSPGSGNSPVPVSASLTSLSANTTYHYRIVATSPGGTSKGGEQMFKTLPNPPAVTTGAASLITQTSATLNAEVNPNGGEVTGCKFEYGTVAPGETSVGCSSPPGSGTSPIAVSATITGLAANTTYHYRIVATSPGGTSKGGEQMFKTLPNPPAVTTGAASLITQTSATLNAEVNPNGGEVEECKLEYGTTPSYGSSKPCSPSPGSGNSPVPVSASLTSLSANTTYHYRIVATSPGGTSKGGEQTFKTLPGPTVLTGAASSIKQTSATLAASVNPNGGEVEECKFEYGTVAPGETSVGCSSPPGSGTSPIAVSATITGLAANTTYHYRIVATNPGGTSKGGEQTFKTLPNLPTVTTGAASSITQTAATLAASVNPNGGGLTECKLEYGTTTSYGSSAPCNPSPGSGNSTVPVSASLTGLTAATTYHFRITATNAGGTSKGSDQTLTTQLPTTLLSQVPGEQGMSNSQAVSASQEHKKPAVPDAELASTSLKESSSGTVTARVSCPADESSCTGTVTLRTLDAVVSSGTGAHQAKKPKIVILTFAVGSFKVAGGRVTSVKLHLSHRARTLLTRSPVLRARATIFARDPTGATHTAQRIVTIRAEEAAHDRKA